MKPLGKVKIEWSSEFAYALGILATDGNLSPDGRHFDVTSKDKDQLVNFMSCLKIKVKIGYKTSGYTGKKITHIQFGDVLFYKFLLSIGFMPTKTKIIAAIKIPEKYFFDFLRGHLDGDGTFFSYWDPRWRSSFMFYTMFISASKEHILWIRKKLTQSLGIRGSLDVSMYSRAYHLEFAKRESRILLKKIYYSPHVICLERKRLKIEKALAIIGEKL